MKTYFYLSKKRINSKGKCPIYCRIASDKTTRSDFSTGIFIAASAWDSKHGNAYNDTESINTRLSTIASNVYKTIADCERESIYQPSEVLHRYQKRERVSIPTLTQIAKEYIQAAQPPERTRIRMMLAVKQFTEIANYNNANRYVSEDLQGFEQMLTAKQYSIHSTLKKMQLLKRLFNYAYGKKYVYQNPFLLYRLPKAPRVTLIQLNDAELKLLHKKQFAADRLNQVRDVFLVQCYTGLSYGDLTGFSRALVTGKGKMQFLRGKRAKTNEDFYLPFLKQAKQLAVKYNYRLPVLCNQKYNAYLKEIADILGIEKRLTTHTGRKTFCQLMIDAGYSAESVARMMGHADFKMTQKHYGRIGELRIEREVLKMAG